MSGEQNREQRPLATAELHSEFEQDLTSGGSGLEALPSALPVQTGSFAADAASAYDLPAGDSRLNGSERFRPEGL